MQLYYINEQTEYLYNLITELYEAYFSDDGDVETEDLDQAYIILEQLKQSCDSLQNDIDLQQESSVDNK